MEEEFVAIWAVAARYIRALAQDTIPRLDNVTDDHCHSRLHSQIFPVSQSGIILTACFVRKRTLFLAKQTYEK